MKTALIPLPNATTLPTEAELLAAIERELDRAVPYVQRDLEQPTGTWDSGAEFQVRRERLAREVTTADKRYNILDAGSPPHTISPKPGKALAFPVPYSPKTAPGSLVARAGGPGGSVVFTRKPVQHPGTEARGWSDLVAKDWQKKLATRIDQALKAVLQ